MKESYVFMSQMENLRLNLEGDVSRQQAGLRWNRNAGLLMLWLGLSPIPASLSSKPQADGELTTLQSGPAPVYKGRVPSSVLTPRVPPRASWGPADPQHGPSLHPCSRPALREPILRVQSEFQGCVSLGTWVILPLGCACGLGQAQETCF